MRKREKETLDEKRREERENDVFLSSYLIASLLKPRREKEITEMRE